MTLPRTRHRQIIRPDPALLAFNCKVEGSSFEKGQLDPLVLMPVEPPALRPFGVPVPDRLEAREGRSRQETPRIVAVNKRFQACFPTASRITLAGIWPRNAVAAWYWLRIRLALP